MQSSHLTWLAFLRLLLVFVACCLLLTQLEIAQRLVQDQTIGLPSPFFSLFQREPLPSPSQLPFIGTSIDPAELSATELERAVAESVAAGFGWVRLRVAWDRIEPTPSNFEWTEIDRALDTLAAANLTPILLLDGSPAWVRALNDQLSVEGRLAPPGDRSAFARFATAVATRYGDRVRYYQLWDEANIAPHWGERQIEPVNYARMFKAAAIAIRASDTDSYILLAALAPTADRGHLAQDEAYFLTRLYAAGAAPYFDALAIQPFGFGERPDDLEVDRRRLNFRRTLLIRQTMLDAGDGETPIWLMRFGWNRAPNSPWQSVSAEEQRTFTLAALEMAYRQWPWVAAMGWPAATDDPTGGFALTPELTKTFRAASTTLLAEARPQHTLTPPLSVWTPVALWLLALAVLIWRGFAAARLLPWQQWRSAWVARPAWQQGILWGVLLLLYFVGQWPPLLLLYMLLAALGFLAQPLLGLAVALFVLPFYDFHKEIDWLGRHWLLPPPQAALLCLLPAAWVYRPKRLLWDRWYGVALGWLIVMILGATGVWYWQVYWVGMVNLVITPLFLFWLIRAWVSSEEQMRTLVKALAAGGILIAAIGLGDWLQGRGTMADGMLRLKGLGYSSNHTALYLIRTVAITFGLMLAAQGRAKLFWILWTVMTGVALLLTGSRGAILLGIPAGALFLLSRRRLPLPSGRRLVGLLVVAGIGLALLAWMWRDRLSNIETIFARTDTWIVAWDLWMEHFFFGVGPEGFWWTFPAHMGISSDIDPNQRHPHLIWLELATSGGLLALLWLLAVAILLYQWLRLKKGALSWLQAGLLAGLIASLAHAQVDAFQALSELASWNWAALALLVTLDQPEE